MLHNHSNSKVTTDKSSVQGNCLTSFQRRFLEKNLDDKLPWQYRQRHREAAEGEAYQVGSVILGTSAGVELEDSS